MSGLKSSIHKLIKKVSTSGIRKIVNSDPGQKEIWDLSFKRFEDFSNHFTNAIDDSETEHRIRLLVVNETLFIREIIQGLDTGKSPVTYADIGDSDGSVRLLLNEFFTPGDLSSIGINLQQQAVDKMKAMGLEAVCADAMDLGRQNIRYDIVSLFETLEHLPDPVGFLTKIHSVVDSQLVISVPFIRKSRVGLNYLKPNWSQSIKPTIENQHIFELSPDDWKRIFLHTGWKPVREKKLLMFPTGSYQRLIMQPYWRTISFEGFWFVSLEKDDTFSSRYVIE